MSLLAELEESKGAISYKDFAPSDYAKLPVKLAILTQSEVVQNVGHRNILKGRHFAQLQELAAFQACRFKTSSEPRCIISLIAVFVLARGKGSEQERRDAFDPFPHPVNLVRPVRPLYAFSLALSFAFSGGVHSWLQFFAPFASSRSISHRLPSSLTGSFPPASDHP
jgi:hypothetical protein